MGPAGAIILVGKDCERQICAMAAAGIKTVETPADLGSTLAAALSSGRSLDRPL